MKSFRDPKYVERYEDVIFDLETALNTTVANNAHQKKDGYRFVVARRKRADLFLVSYRSVETSAADLQIVYRSSTDYLRIVCRMSAEYLQNVCRMSAEMICNLCRRSAEEGGMNSKHNNRRTAPIKHLLFLS